MDDDLVALWNASDPLKVGERLREARRRANLTQTELGGDVASSAYVSRLEAGARRGDLELFVAFANRLSMDARDLLIDRSASADDPRIRLQIDYAELALTSGNAVQAELGIADLTDETLADLSLDLARAVRRVRAGVYEATGRLSMAITEGEILAAGERRDLHWINDLIALSRCYRESGDFTRAIAVGSRAEGEIERVGLGGTTEAIQLVLTVASAYSNKGDLVYATQMCREAAARADELGSPLATASAYWNASVFEFDQGRVDEAVPLARRALSEFERAEDSRNIGRLRGALGVFLTQLDPPELAEAIEVLERSRAELIASSAGRYDVARSSWALARAYFQNGDRDAARRRMDEALELADEGAPLILASVTVLRGQFAFADGDRDAARVRYREAIHILTGIGSDRSAGQLWFELADLLERVGDTEGALTAYKSAAASVGFAERNVIGGSAGSAAPANPV
jgi:tetratricopeptide (TPR) repeat protein